MDFIMNHMLNDADNRWDVTLSGEVDIFNSNDLKVKLIQLISEKQVDLMLICKNLEYIDSTALGALVAVLKHVKAYGGQVHVKELRPNLSKLFRITNLDKVFIIEGEKND